MNETYNPWTVVNLVFHHLVDQGFRPQLGGCGDPAEPAAQLLRALGVQPGRDSAGPAAEQVQEELAAIRAKMFGEH